MTDFEQKIENAYLIRRRFKKGFPAGMWTVFWDVIHNMFAIIDINNYGPDWMIKLRSEKLEYYPHDKYAHE